MENEIIKSKEVNTNKVTLIGKIDHNFRFNHKINNNTFYKSIIKIKRLSDVVDSIPVIVSEKVIDDTKDYTGTNVAITGSFRSYNRKIDGKTKLELFVFIETIDIIENESNMNNIELDGYICKPVVLRKTPLKNVPISDVMVAINRIDGCSYIPCVCWGPVANRTASYEVGTRIKLTGRIQSRNYVKKLSETDEELRVAYEVSVLELEMFNKMEDYINGWY